MASVMFLGAVLILLTAIIIARGFAQSEIEVSDIDYEQAFHVAEGGLDDFIVDLQAAGDPAAVTTGQSAASLDSKDAVVAAADAMVSGDPTVVRSAPEGEVVIVAPIDADVVYAVAASPNWDSPNRMVRVLELEYFMAPTTYPGWSASFAILAAGNLDVSGSATVSGPGANVHANGSLGNGAATRVSGCGSESVASGYVDPDPSCPPSPSPAQDLPDIDARMMHPLSWYDLCPDGAHFGPGHPTSPGGTAGEPCSGPLSGNPTGWTGGGSSWSVNGKVEGVYYVYGADVSGKPGKTTGPSASRGPADMTIVIEKHYAVGQSAEACPAQGTGGDIRLNAQSMFSAHSSTKNPGEAGIALVAEGAVNINGGAAIDGLVFARTDFSENGNSTINGSVLFTDVCDNGARINGNMALTYAGPVTTPFNGIEQQGSELTLIGKGEL